MKTRLALVACKDSTQGPWIRPRGNETGVRVQYLGEGERIIMIYEQHGTQFHEHLDDEGTFDLPPDWSKIRFDKVCVREGFQYTQVDLLVA